MINRIKKIARDLATLIGVTAAGSVLAQETANMVDCKVNPLCSSRFRVEQTENAETDSRQTKTTFGWANCADAHYMQELGRVYNYEGSEDGDDYTAVGLKSPTLTLSGTETAVRAFGTFGDVEGFGVETKTDLGQGTTVFVNFEDNQTTDPTREGFGVDQQAGDLTLKLGYDHVSTPSGDTDYALAGAVWDIDSNDQVGAGFRRASSETGNTDTGLAYWCHFGKDEAWGHRTRLSLDDNPDNTYTISGETIIAQNPTFSRFSAPWMVDRTVENGGMFNEPVVENALTAERTPLGDRSRGGFVATVEGSATYGNETETTGYVAGGVGYRFNLTDKANVTLTGTARHDLSTEDTDFGGSAHLNWETNLGNFYAEVSGDDDGKAYGSVGWSCTLPNVLWR